MGKTKRTGNKGATEPLVTKNLKWFKTLNPKRNTILKTIGKKRFDLQKSSGLTKYRDPRNFFGRGTQTFGKKKKPGTQKKGRDVGGNGHPNLVFRK